ncbi:MAG: hypothetical protein DRG82_16620 [Deltaproteobacteria bacterium]|nr:MAG: hypothetical protein DRG82_16620 [Deltaproteobacteria bacterium]
MSFDRPTAAQRYALETALAVNWKDRLYSLGRTTELIIEKGREIKHAFRATGDGPGKGNIFNSSRKKK